jgi:pimeloyl-ACP methyl ester carboxylesterase
VGAVIDKFLTVNGLKLHYVEYGDPAGPPLVCLHGATMHAHMWDLLATQLGKKCRVLALTARGHGESERADDYSLETHAADAASFIETVVRSPAVLCGFSMGGAIALLVAALHPSDVASLILVEGGTRNNPAGGQRLRTALAALLQPFESVEDAIPATRIAFGDVSDAVLHPYLERALGRRDDGTLRAKFDPNIGRIGGPDTESLRWRACAMIKCPTLIVRGSRSDILDAETAERMAATIPTARLVEVESGHFVPLENPGGFYRAVNHFI